MRSNLHVCIHLQIKDNNLNSSLRMRRLAAAAPKPPIEYKPTWAFPGIDPVKVFCLCTLNGNESVMLILCMPWHCHASGQHVIHAAIADP